MEPVLDSFRQLTSNSKDVARRLLTIGANRLELLRIEVQEERGLLLHSLILAFGAAAFGLLAGIALSGLLLFLFYDSAPITVLLALTLFYGAAASVLYRRLRTIMAPRQEFAATFQQLQKDHACLERMFE